MRFARSFGTLGWAGREVAVEERTKSRSPGNVVLAEFAFEHVCEVFVSLGRRGVSGKDVVRELGREVDRFLRSGVPVGEHLADQLLLPMALVGSGSFRTLEPTQHTTTNIDVIEAFLGPCVTVTRDSESVLVTVEACRPGPGSG